MKLYFSREQILRPLQKVIGAVERKQTTPMLNHILITSSPEKVSITSTDLEIEIIAALEKPSNTFDGKITLPAQKLLDICHSLPENSEIEFTIADNDKIEIKSGKNSRFLLASLSAEEFPIAKNFETSGESISIPRSDLRVLIEKSSFAMAKEDFRPHLNGLLLEIGENQIRTIATDGHRLALSQINHTSDIKETKKIILPRKGVHEVKKLLDFDDEQTVNLSFCKNQFRVLLSDVQLTSSLVAGEFPDYQRVLPNKEGNCLVVGRAPLKQVLSRVSILSAGNRGVRLILDNDSLQVQAHNLEQEEAEEYMKVDYKGEKLEVGFNVSYLLDVLDVLESKDVEIFIRDANSSVLLLPRSPEESSSTESEERNQYVIMPMRL